MGKALYRKYRSRSLDEIVGQEHITTLLKQAIANNAVSHAYLLTGPRGVGKTSIARIIAHEINQLSYEEESTHLDIIEIDAASNNGVEDIRDLREKVHIAPVSAPKKVYIIDEVHMLSKQAFNALLKTLEEPPAHVVFILATTDVDKLPATIISRVQRFNFRSIPLEQVVAHLDSIAKKENIDITEAALARIAKHGGGSFRDSIVLLDQLRHTASDQTIDVSNVDATLGSVNTETLHELVAQYHAQNLAGVSATLRQLEQDGAHAKHIIEELITLFSDTITEHPENIQALARLSTITSTQFGFVKLLVALTIDFSDTAPKSTPTPAPTPTPQKPIKPATTPKKETKNPAESKPKPAPAEQATPPATEAKPFDWATYLGTVKQSNVPLHSLLNQTQFHYDGKTLTIYAGKAFRGNKLRSAKNLAELHEFLKSLSITADIEVIDQQKPSDNSDVSAVTNIMGGGEEVTPDGK